MKSVLALSLSSLALIFTFAQSATAAPARTAGDYCLAVRGNGELAPAHWGALAQVVEKMGLPKAMSGGSSASISLFLLESIAQNPAVQKGTDAEKRAAASLLLKSLQGYLEMVASRPEWQEMAQMGSFLKGDTGQNMEFVAWLKQMVETDPRGLMALIQQNRAQIMKSLTIAVDIGLVNVQTLAPLMEALNKSSASANPVEQLRSMKRVQFFAGEIYSSVMLLGKFNAETDQNLFFRAGVVSFTQLAKSFGRVGNFYAGREMDSKQVLAVQSFVATCAPLAKGKTWDELRAIEPKCDGTLKMLGEAYRASGLPKNLPSREMDRVGASVAAYPATSVLANSAYFEALNALSHYSISLDASFGKDFSVKAEDVLFGYWGPAADLARIEKNLKTPFKSADGRMWDFSKDAKSRRFYALGDESWAQVLSASPAEPGLAPLQEVVINRGSKTERVYSAGGWSDLHPGAVLKAAGCDNVVYVTRRGGESLFGQGVAKRLLSFDDISWDRLATDAARKPANKLRNNNGDPSDMTSEWSRLYNLANPESSFNRALQVFDSVVCTDWDQFDITKSGDLNAMIGEAYRAPWVARATAKSQDNQFDPKLGFRPYAGCLPF